MAEQFYPVLPGIQPPGLPSATAPLALNLEHKAQGLARLIAQYVGKPRVEQILCIYLDQVQLVESMLWALITERTIETAVGTQLDGIGDIVGQERQGLSDDDYRPLLRARVRANNSEGTAPDVISVANAALDDPGLGEIFLEFTGPASFELRITNEFVFDEKILNKLVQAATAAGVGAFVIVTLTAEANRFVFADPGAGDDTFSVETGFDSATTPTTGKGQLARVLDQQTG